MKAAFAAGQPVALEEVDLFCDGTAVRQAGQLSFEVCRETLTRLVTVSNAEVSQAMRVLWEGLRAVSEPSGAMGLAAVLREREKWMGKRVLVVLCGANIDFQQLGVIAQSTDRECGIAMEKAPALFHGQPIAQSDAEAAMRLVEADRPQQPGTDGRP